MIRQQAYQYRLIPSARQEHLMRQYVGCCRHVYNRAWKVQQERYAAGEKRLTYQEICKLLTQWRADPERPWLADAPVHPLQQSLKDLDRAYQNFFAKRTAHPRKKKRGQRDSARYPDKQQIKLDQGNSRIFLPKLGWVRYRNSRKVLGEVRNVTVSCKAGKWCVSIQTQREVEQPVHPSTSAIGIDLGIVNFATLSNGVFFVPLSSFKKLEKALRKAQQSLSRKKKISKNWHKAKKKVQKLQASIRDCRHDYLHKFTHAISKNHAVVCMEDLKVSNMSASASGTIENPGKHVKQKSGLNKAILDQGWYECRRQMAYKCGWSGGQLIVVPPMYTSQTCPGCGHVRKSNRQTQDGFICVHCGYAENADVVGAINILRAGHARIACQVNPDVRGQQQEPLLTV